jgi:hypothetical protein
MKKLLTGLALLVSVSSSANCLVHIEGHRFKVINILATSDFSNCSDDALRHSVAILNKFAHEKTASLKKERRKSETGDEQFRLMTEINGAKASLSLINQELL